MEGGISIEILLVDDQHEIRRLITAGLVSLSREINVSAVPSGEEALLVATRQPVHLLVADVRLVGMSGLELVEKIRALQPHLKIVLITGVTDVLTRQKVTSFPVDAYFFKPIEMENFLIRVAKILDLEPPEEWTSAGSRELEIKAQEPDLAPDEFQPTYEVTQADLPAEPLNQLELAVRLAKWQRALQAEILLLLDAKGRIAAQAGSFPKELEQHRLMSLFRGIFAAGQRIAGELNSNEPHNIQFYSGGDYAGVLVQIGSQAMIMIKNVSGQDKAVAFERLFDRSMQLYRLARGEHLSQSTREKATNPDTVENGHTDDLGNLEDLLKKASEGELDTTEAANFWNAEGDQSQSGSWGEDTLPYDEARKLGISPEPDGE